MPVFGICLGHQLLGLTLGAKTNKSLPDNLLEIPQIETKDSSSMGES